MPGPITYAAVTLLARDRIGQIRRAFAAKKAAGTAKELELHVLHLATEAEAMMNASQPVIEPPVRLYGPPLTDHVSRFTLLGAVGPDLPRYAAYFAPGQRWLFDTLHKGSPDEHREHVLANSTNLVFDFWKRVGPLVDAEFSDPKKRDEAKKKMQAYILGHLCHVATDVLAHPYFESVEARLGDPAAVPPIRFMRRDDVAGAFDVRISDQFFARGTDTRTKKWADWFPTPGDVPGAFSSAMAASIQSLYGARAEGLPAFEEEFKKIDPAPPPLSADLIQESIAYFRNIIEIERVWTLADWLGATAAMFLPMAFAYFGALALPLGKDLSRALTAADGPEADGVRTYESVVYPVAVSSLGPLVSMIIVSASGRGLRAEGVTGWIQAGLSLVASIGFFATLGGAGGARWTLWFVMPLALAVAQSIFVLIRGAKENSRRLLWLGPMVQVGLAVLFMLLYRAWLHEGVEELQKPSDKRNNLSAFGDFAAWLGIVVVLWIVHALLWRYLFSASVPDDQNEFANGEPRQFLRLYDDVALIHDLKAPLDSEKLADLTYPPARRPILKMWWEGVAGSTVQVRVDQDRHDRIAFHWSVAPAVADRTVFVPVAPVTIEKWGQLLAVAVTGDGTIGKLKVKPARDDEKGLELAPGSFFADPGDDKTALADHNAEAGKFKDVGADEATALTLFHTPRPRLAERMGRNGVVVTGERTDQPAKAGSLLQPLVGNPLTLRITTAGIVGVAQFTFQNGAGPVSAATPTAPQVPLPAVFTTLLFTPGAFVVGDSWTIVPNGTATPAGANTSTGGLVATITPRYHATNATDGTSPLLRRMFSPGDVIEITSVPAEQRIIAEVVNETDVVLSSAFNAAIVPAGIGYKRAKSDRRIRARGASTVSTPPVSVGIGPNDVQVDIAATTFGSLFVAGDIVEIGGTTFQRRRVVAVKDATPVGSGPTPTNLLELDAPPLPPAGGASATGSVLQSVGGATPRQYHATNDVNGSSPNLLALFRTGDVIEIASAAPIGERKTVEDVLNKTDLVVSTAFAAAIPAAGIGYKRVTFIDRLSDAEGDGHRYVADASDVFGDGESVMNDAADLAALLCLGAASRLAPNGAPVTPTGATIPVHRVYQVFRNWNLDRRRVNEWKLLVSGGAASERRGDYRAAEEAAPVDGVDAAEAFSDAFVAKRRTADVVVRDQGWLGVFRSWVDMASRARTDTTSGEVFRPGAPSNRDLSRAMAYLIDAADGVTP